MRAENEINAAEYAELKKDMDAESARLDEQEKNLTEQQEITNDFSANLERIEKALQGLCNGSDKTLNQKFMGRMVESVIPESNTRFIWNIRTGADKLTPFHTSVNGRKNKAIVSVDEFTEGGDEPSIHKKSRTSDMLHRLHSDKGLFSKVAIEWDFPITFEMARAYQKSKGKYLREFQWQGMSMAVRIEFGK